MSFYDLSKPQRAALVQEISATILQELNKQSFKRTLSYFSDSDTYSKICLFISWQDLFFRGKITEENNSFTQNAHA